MVTLIDSDNLINRVFHVHQDLCTRNGIATGGIYGFLNSVFYMLKNKKDNEYLVFVWDTNATRKKSIYPEYKAHRGTKNPLMIDQKVLVQQMLSILDMQQVAVEHEEADDVISTLVHKCRKIGHKVVIYSRDHDFEQLITNSVSVLCPDSGFKYTLKDVDWVLKNRGVHPTKLKEIMLLMGDRASDNVAGVEGFGIVSASKMIKANGDVATIMNDIPNSKTFNRKGELVKISSTIAKKIEKGREQVELNKQLVVLDDRVKFPFTLKTDWNPKWTMFNMLLQGYECYKLINKYKFFQYGDYEPDNL